MNSPPGPDTVHAWLVPSPHGARGRARQVLAAAAARVLGTDPGRLEVGRAASGRPTARVETVRGTEQAWVSLSYGPAVLAVAASLTGPVGIDVEGPTRPEVVRLAERWFDPDEAAWVGEQVDQQRAFLLLWTAKEALGKALGTGLRDGGLRRRVPLPPVSDGSFRALAGGLWLAHPVPREPLVLAVASGVPVSRLVLHPTGELMLDLADSAAGAAGGPASAAGDHSAAPDAPARSTARSRASLPVVVRGN